MVLNLFVSSVEQVLRQLDLGQNRSTNNFVACEAALQSHTFTTTYYTCLPFEFLQYEIHSRPIPSTLTCNSSKVNNGPVKKPWLNPNDCRPLTLQGIVAVGTFRKCLIYTRDQKRIVFQHSTCSISEFTSEKYVRLLLQFNSVLAETIYHAWN